jgi:parvulin-like peptidyl-prolyl isomerase
MAGEEKKSAKVKNSASKTNKSLINSKSWLNFIRWLAVFFTACIIGLMVLIWGIYSKNWQNYFIESIEKTIPFPAAGVGYANFVSINEFNRSVKTIKISLESREAAFPDRMFDFSTPEGLKRLEVIKKNVLNQLIESKIIEGEAKNRNIKISDGEARDITEQILNRDTRREENVNQLKIMYNWDENDFAKQVIKKMLIRNKLEEKLKSSGELDDATNKKIDIIKNKIESGESFENVAREYSEASSRQYGGLIPPFSQNEAPEVFKNAAFLLKEGETSGPLETEEGWQLIKVEKVFFENNQKTVEIRHILVRKNSFENWLLEKKSEAKIKIFLKSYYWHSQMGKLYFKDESLNDFEDKINRDFLKEQSQEIDFMLNKNK